MIEEIRNINSTKKDLRKFGLTVGIIIVVIGGFLLFKQKEAYSYFILIGVLLLGGGILKPVVLKPFYWIWMVFATILGYVMTRVILSVLFYLVIAPISLILRLFGKQFLELKWTRSSNTYWNYRTTKQPENHNYEKQF